MTALPHLLMLGLLLLSIEGLGHAQVEHDTGSLIGVPQRAHIPETGDQAQRGRIALSEFARCSVDRHAVQLKKLLLLPAEKTDGRAWATLADNECLASGEMKFKPMLLRGAIFTELYRRRAGHEKTRFASMSAAPFVVVEQPATATEDDKLQMALLEFGDCVVRRDLSDASAMIVAQTASAEQDAALQRLKPFLGTCLPSGQQIKLVRPILEGAVAEVLYRGSAQAAPTEAK